MLWNYEIFFRHKTYIELFTIDIKKGDKSLLKSIIRKLNKIQNEDDREEEEEDCNSENIQKKSCFILIYNCGRTDLLDVNLY